VRRGGWVVIELVWLCARARRVSHCFQPFSSLNPPTTPPTTTCQNIDNLTAHYVALLGAYRGLYILNWAWRYATEARYSQWLVWLSGLLQTGLYADFFYYYAVCWKANKRLQLPA
jgi:hypothetical protein